MSADEDLLLPLVGRQLGRRRQLSNPIIPIIPSGDDGVSRVLEWLQRIGELTKSKK